MTVPVHLAPKLWVHANIALPPPLLVAAVFQLSFIIFSQVMVHMMVKACFIGNSKDYRVQFVQILVRWARSVARPVHFDATPVSSIDQRIISVGSSLEQREQHEPIEGLFFGVGALMWLSSSCRVSCHG